jgi:hypothetical protein
MEAKYDDIISIENLLPAWEEFLKGKRKRKDVQEFSFNLADNILSLYQDLKTLAYKHGSYQSFNISALNRETSTKQVSATAYCIMRYIASFILILTKSLFTIHILAV